MNGQQLKPGSTAPAEGWTDNLATVIGYAPTPIVAVDASGRIRHCNKAFSDLTGFTCDEVIRTGQLSALVPTEWRERAASVFLSHSTAYPPGKYRMELLHKSGTRIPVEMSYSTISDDTGNAALYLLIFSDVTEYKLAETAANKRASGIARALQIAHIGTWDLNLITGVFTCSDEVYRIAGVAPESCAIKLLADLPGFICPDDYDMILRAFEGSIKGDGVSDVTFRVVGRDGMVRIVRAEGERIPDADGTVVRLFGTIQDITERKRTEDELKVAKSQAELYVDLMGHDINNMNQIAMGYLELAEGIIEAHGSLGKEDRFLITRPIETLRDNSRLIDNVRKIQKSKAGVFKTENIELEGMLRDAIARFSDVAGRNVRIDLVSSCSCTVMANELLKEVFLNLIGNAIKHSTGPLCIKIIAEKCEDGGNVTCRVAVEDDGPGIPEDLKKKLFDRLSLEKTRASGKGFGLCLTKLLVDDFQGQFWVEDRIKGDHTQGCRFIVMLPAVDGCWK